MPEFTLTPEGQTVLRRAVTSIRNNLTAWDQNSFANRSEYSVCGTTACLAGWVVANELGLTGMELFRRADLLSTESGYLDIEAEALYLLGLIPSKDNYTAEGRNFTNTIFYHINEYDEDDNCITFRGDEDGVFEKFVAYLTEQTGIDFDI